MKNMLIHKTIQFATTLAACVLLAGAHRLHAQTELTVIKDTRPGMGKPIPVALSGFTGEAKAVIEFDLYVQGFKFVPAEQAQYVITGSNNGNIQGRLTDRINGTSIIARQYTGGSLRQQTHQFTDDIVLALTKTPGIGQTRIAFKVDKGQTSELCVADFDGANAKMMTSDGSIVAAPAWVPGRAALYYTSYKLNNPDILFHDLASGKRSVFSRRSGLNTSAAVSPDGRQVAMILSENGRSPDLYVSNSDGTGLKRLTSTPTDESSPCWSPDGRWICFATKIGARRTLAKVPASGGDLQRISTGGVVNPTEPAWSPDGKWIAFTAQMGNFEICAIPAGGGDATVLVSGEDPSWAPNSRTLIFARRAGGKRTLSLLDVFTKQSKDVPRISGSNSQPAWAQ